MRLARYVHGGRAALGAVHGEAVVPAPWPDFETLFALDDPAAAVRAFTPDPARAVRPERLLAPVVHRCQVIGTGGNYADHAAEAARAAVVVSEPVFLPFLWGAVIGPDDEIVIPYPETQTDYEVELAVVIGRTARRLTPENAMDHVFGYTIVNDVSAREVMTREKMQVMLSKSPDTFVPVGPHVVTTDEIPDPYALGIATYLNGGIRQKSTTGAMTVRIPELLTAITRQCTLYPGDVVTTGTPGGVGFFREPQEFMRHGDTIVAEVEGVGRLSNRVVASWETGR
jgi:2-keto-4-pentenoate hydratase/2-oxohepta-3-ene-1,7-dioic acid hydratase in catechol pathway